MAAKPSRFNRDFRDSHPQIWESFNALAEKCHNAGPLTERERRLVKVAMAIGAGLEGGTHSAVRNARAQGVTDEELVHVAVLAITTIGFPSAMRSLSWLGDASAQSKNHKPRPKRV
jgi:4-carboxymuconolactone decarboxylase